MIQGLKDMNYSFLHYGEIVGIEREREEGLEKRKQEEEKYSFLLGELKDEDLDRGFLQTLDSLIVGHLKNWRSEAERIFQEIQSNTLHKIFVAYAVGEEKGNKGCSDPVDNKKVIVGTTTLLFEPKFIFGGGRVRHIEDVSVRKEFQGLGIGSWSVEHATTFAESVMGCVKIVLDCSDETMPFYESLGYSYQDNCIKIIA
jgi:glucosamine-phosphate N-acetyltransferase